MRISQVFFLPLLFGFSITGFALDLKNARTPIHYECRHVLAGGIWTDEKTGVFKSGAVRPAPNDTFRLIADRLENTKDQRLKRCEEERKRTGGYKAPEREFCVTKILQGRGKSYEDTHYCEITTHTSLANTNHALQCYLARIYLDTDKLFGVSIDSLDGIALDLPLATTVNKFDCQRLDR
jgi:hypothetical protein